MSAREYIIERMKRTAKALQVAEEYLASGKMADKRYFRPLFVGRDRLPHPAWVKNFVIPRLRKSLAKTEKRLEVVDRKAKEHRISQRRRHNQRNEAPSS
jgi:hypothetical protein